MTTRSFTVLAAEAVGVTTDCVVSTIPMHRSTARLFRRFMASPIPPMSGTNSLVGLLREAFGNCSDGGGEVGGAHVDLAHPGDVFAIVPGRLAMLAGLGQRPDEAHLGGLVVAVLV